MSGITNDRLAALIRAAERWEHRYNRLASEVLRTMQMHGNDVTWALGSFLAHNHELATALTADTQVVATERAHYNATHKATARKRAARARARGLPPARVASPLDGGRHPSPLDSAPVWLPPDDPRSTFAHPNHEPNSQPLRQPADAPQRYGLPRADDPNPEFQLAPPPAAPIPTRGPMPVTSDGYIDNSRLATGFGPAPPPKPHPDADAMAALEAKIQEEELQSMRDNAQTLPPGYATPEGPVVKLSASPLDE